MKALLFIIFSCFTVLTFNINSQAEIPQVITSGTFVFSRSVQVPSPPNSNLQIGNSVQIFSNLTDSLQGLWGGICVLPNGCRLGTTFSLPHSTTIGDVQFSQGSFVLNGVTYPNVYYKGEFIFTHDSFFIPKSPRRKGFVRFSKPFTMQGRIIVCDIPQSAMPCPAANILFDNNISGTGKVLVTLKYTQDFLGRVTLTQLNSLSEGSSFIYQFE